MYPENSSRRYCIQGWALPYVCYRGWSSCFQKQKHCILTWFQLFIQHILYEHSFTPGTELPRVQNYNLKLPAGQLHVNFKSLQCQESKPGFITVTPTCCPSQVYSWLDISSFTVPPELAFRDSSVHPSLSAVTHLRNHYGTQYPLSMHITFAQTISYVNFHKRLCTGIPDSRLSPLQYFLASTVYNGILCA